MGGEGHVFDMIRRTKQNRKMIQERRDRMKDLVEKMNEKPLWVIRTSWRKGKWNKSKET